jgi:vacuolar-type H+-ATPase subunit F/Vma7
VIVIGDEDTVHAFGIIGVRGYVYKKGMDIKDIDEDFFIISEKVADELREDIDILEEEGKIIVEIPDKSGSIRKEDPIAALIKRSIGVELR